MGPTFRERVRSLDDAVDARVDEHRSEARDSFFYGVSSAADHALLWVALGAVRAARRGDPGGAFRLAAILGLESAITNGVVKSLFGRVRPPSGHYDHDDPLPHGMRRPITSSFPSGHAVTAFTAATILSEGTRLGPAYYGLAALVASSRVYVRLHHVSDVVVGAGLGIVLGRLARHLLPANDRPARG
jgi:undecaprenyl-diphosphatase